jgi:hypothetical protein
MAPQWGKLEGSTEAWKLLLDVTTIIFIDVFLM